MLKKKGKIILPNRDFFFTHYFTGKKWEPLIHDFLYGMAIARF